MAVGSKANSCLLFDWGDTLMRVFTDFDGPMKGWPRVAAMPHAEETLAALHSAWTLALATNADVSDEADIRAALRRVSLDQWLDKIYCYKKIGHKKPSPEFFQYILDDLGLTPQQVVMVGDDYEADVLGANRCGLCAIWFNQRTDEVQNNALCRTVHDLQLLPAALSELMEDGM